MEIEEVSKAISDSALAAAEKLRNNPDAEVMDFIEWASNCQTLLVSLAFNGFGDSKEDMEMYAEGIGELATLAPTSVKAIAIQQMQEMARRKHGVDNKHDHGVPSKPRSEKPVEDVNLTGVYL